MQITEDNIEIYLFDFTEGTLSCEEIAELRAYISLNPKWKRVFEKIDIRKNNFETPHLNHDFLVSLKKPVFIPTVENRLDDLFIQDIEGIISTQDLKQLRNLISQQPSLEIDYKLYSFTRSTPDYEITFPLKHKLYKSVTRYKIIISLKYAAIITIFLSTLFMVKEMGDYPGSIIRSERKLNENPVSFSQEEVYSGIDYKISRGFYPKSLTNDYNARENNDCYQRIIDLLPDSRKLCFQKRVTEISLNIMPVSVSDKIYIPQYRKTIKDDVVFFVEKNINKEANNLYQKSISTPIILNSKIILLKKVNPDNDYALHTALLDDINDKMIIPVVEKDKLGERKLNWRNLFYVTAKILNSRINNKSIVTSNDLVNSEIFAVRLGDLEIQHSFAK